MTYEDARNLQDKQESHTLKIDRGCRETRMDSSIDDNDHLWEMDGDNHTCGYCSQQEYISEYTVDETGLVTIRNYTV